METELLIQKSYRNYTFTTEIDNEHISNGRCPSYALLWGKHNNQHWPEGHDYFIGNGNNISDDSKELREILSKRLQNGLTNKKLIFCDLDGVLADFDQGVKNKFNISVDEIDINLMWSVINKSNTFFETLPWMAKGSELWENIKEYEPIILTGVPYGSSRVSQEKINWCKRELGDHIQVITCLTKNKAKYCLPGSILIDDRINNLKAWNDKGGMFILYNEEHLESILYMIKNYMDSELHLLL